MTKFVAEEEIKENMTMQKLLSGMVLDNVDMYNKNKKQLLPVRFFFYSNTKAKISKLRHELLSRSFLEVSNAHRVLKSWGVVTMVVMPMDDAMFDTLVDELNILAYGFDCKFDGWEVEISSE